MMFSWAKRIFRRKKAERKLTSDELERALEKARILQREAMHQAYFSHNPFIEWLEKEKRNASV